MVEDLTAKGWLPTDLAKRAAVSDMTVSRFLRGHTQTARTAKKLAKALGHSVRRYITAADRRSDERRDGERRDGDRREGERRQVEA